MGSLWRPLCRNGSRLMLPRLGNSIRGREVSSLPLEKRDFFDLVKRLEDVIGLTEIKTAHREVIEVRRGGEGNWVCLV